MHDVFFSRTQSAVSVVLFLRKTMTDGHNILLGGRYLCVPATVVALDQKKKKKEKRCKCVFEAGKNAASSPATGGILLQ